MNLPFHLDVGQYPRRMRWFMTIAWMVIAVKCVLVWWAVDRWNMALNPWWVIAPTLMFATLVTVIWATHHES